MDIASVSLFIQYCPKVFDTETLFFFSAERALCI